MIDIPVAARRFDQDHLLQIAMPMGGIGAGCVCLSGEGSLIDWSIRNRPATTGLPDGWRALDGAFAVLRVTAAGGKAVTRLVEGPLPVEKIYDQGLQAQGYRKCGHEGWPRFGKATFAAHYPFGTVLLEDAAVPVRVEITGFSPLIPGDDKNSSLPCALLEYTLENSSSDAVSIQFSMSMRSPAEGKGGAKEMRNGVIPGVGAHFWNLDPVGGEQFGSGAIGILNGSPRIKAMWLRGGWFDSLSALWRELSEGTLQENDGSADPRVDGHNGATVLVEKKLAPGEKVTYAVVVAWHFPNVHALDETLSLTPIQPGSEQPAWRPYYAGQFGSAAEVVGYVKQNYAALRDRTLASRDALYGSTVPAEVIDAVASNLAILKSPTVLRQENGNLWAWEGCFTTRGSCPGSCTHVWNYAQAFCHLFPKLERTLREQELLRSMDESGHVNFRAALPDGPNKHDWHPAADGQLGGIMKLYRDWQISGDTAWMKGLYPAARRSLTYCIRRWDPEERGGLFEPHHNTYDIEFWGPDGMCGSIYVGALAALAAMAEGLSETVDAAYFGGLSKKAAALLDSELFNGEYYFQRVMFEGLKDQSFAEEIARQDHPNPQMQSMLRAEGPKYQYGTGCLSDGVIGDWFARQYGVATTLDRDHVRSTLKAIHAHNFKRDLSEHACTQRPGYAMGKEAGLLLCSWPRGGKPTLPFVYSDEVWTGIEYQVASHLIGEGMVDEGLEIVRAVRARYEGHVRNPFNEYECGSYYARALASFALLTSISGFRYSAVDKTMRFAPKMTQLPFTCFFSTNSGFGTVTIDAARLTIALVEGTLELKAVEVTRAGGAQWVVLNARVTPQTPLHVPLK